MNTDQNYVGKGDSAITPELSVELAPLSALHEWATGWLNTLSSPPSFLSESQVNRLRGAFSILEKHYQERAVVAAGAVSPESIVDIVLKGHADNCEALNSYLREQGITQLTISPMSHE